MRYLDIESGNGSSIHEFCSLRQLAQDIGFLYSNMTDYYDELSELDVRKIQNLILSNNYTLSPINLYKYEPNKRHIFQPYKCSSYNEPICCGTKQEDTLVLTGLGRMLNLYFQKANIVYSPANSLGLHLGRPSFYRELYLIKKKVKRLYRLDLMRTVLSMDRNFLLMKLSHIVKDSQIMELVCKHLDSPILDVDGREIPTTTNSNYYTFGCGCGIPSVGFLTMVLLHVFLTELDHLFPFAFTGVSYKRSFQDVYLYCHDEASFDEEKLHSFLETLSISLREVSYIEPGDGVFYCYKGTVQINQNGYIITKFNEKMEINEND